MIALKDLQSVAEYDSGNINSYIFVTHFMRILITLLLLTLAFSTFAQSKKKRRKSANTEQNAPTTLEPGEEPYYPKKEYGPKKSRKSRKKGGGPTYESQDEFEARMRETVKTIRKNEKNLMRPQYTNPMYFGHKRPPKKRPPGKMKYCKVCGIRH